MGFSCGIGGMVPFTRRWGVSLISYAVNGIRGATALPLSIPAAPQGNRCCALRSPPACLTAAGSTRLARPYGTRSMPRFASVRHPWRPDLVIPASVRRFQRGHNTLAAISQIKAIQVSLKARFCRPDKAQPPSGNWCRGDNAGWRVTRLSGLRRFSGFVTVGRIRRSRHPAIVPR